jgi:hypothetical protein
MEVLFNANSEDDLIAESDSSESGDSEWTGSPEIAFVSDVADEATPKTSSIYCLPLPPSTANTGLNTDIQNTVLLIYLLQIIFLSMFVKEK